MPESDVSVTKVGCICNKLGLAGEINNGQARCKRDALPTELTAQNNLVLIHQGNDNVNY